MGKKGSLSELDIGQILRRYSAVTVMGLIREIAKCDSSRLDWNALVRKSNTGINSAREYQALWRHIAYRAELEDSYEEDTEPLDDDSDLEFELEATPVVSSELTNEAVVWVKADMQRHGISGKRKVELLSRLKPKDTDAVPAVVNQAPASSGLSASATDVISKGASVTANGSVSDTNTSSLPSGNGNQVSSAAPESPSGANLRMAVGQSERKKRKLWTPEEDQELIAAVEKCGEGNWTNILKGAFTHDRTAAQLSQRWALIRKRREVQAAAANKLTPGSSSKAPATGQGSGVLPGQLSPPAEEKTPAVKGGNSWTSVPPLTLPPTAAGNSAVAASTTTVPLTSSSGVQSQAQGLLVSGSSTTSPGSSGVITTANGAATTSSSVDTVAVKVGTPPVRPGGVPARVGTNNVQRQAQAVGAARSTAGSSTAVAAMAVGQGRSAGAKSGGSSVGAGRLIAPGALVMSAAAAQAASVGGSEMWQASTLPPTSVHGSVPVKYGARNNASSIGGRGMLMKQMTGPDPGVQAAAVAAGARIAPHSAAASLLKAAQSGNVVHIGPGGVPITKSGHANQTGMGHATNVGQRGSSGAIVHYIRTGAGAPPPTLPGMIMNGQRPGQQSKTQPAKSSSVNQTSNVASKPSTNPGLSNTTAQPLPSISQGK